MRLLKVFMLVILAALMVGCGPAYEITRLSYSSSGAHVSRGNATTVGLTPTHYVVVEVRGRIEEPGWVLEDIEAKEDLFSLDPSFELVPTFRRVEGEGRSEFVGYHTFGFDEFVMREEPLIRSGDKKLLAPGAGPSTTSPMEFAPQP
jgi:hypothetical protein